MNWPDTTGRHPFCWKRGIQGGRTSLSFTLCFKCTGSHVHPLQGTMRSSTQREKRWRGLWKMWIRPNERERQDICLKTPKVSNSKFYTAKEVWKPLKEVQIRQKYLGESKETQRHKGTCPEGREEVKEKNQQTDSGNRWLKLLLISTFPHPTSFNI